MIENYIYDKLYYKIYPNEPTQLDTTIYENCVKLSWLQFSHFKLQVILMINIENCVTQATTFLQEFHIERNPNKKFLNFQKMIDCIREEFNFYDLCIDELIPIVYYIIICVKPKRLSSDINYCLLLMEPNSRNNFIATLFECITRDLKQIDYSFLFKMTKEEYESNCEKAKQEAFGSYS